MGQTPDIELFKSACSHSNVDSTRGCVEAIERRDRSSSWQRAFVIATSLLLALVFWAPGCVDTAECNATVSCPKQEVCYAYTCRAICETQSQCSDGEACRSCMDGATGGDDGECFGEDLQACVPEE
jgi:hypothetical protein